MKIGPPNPWDLALGAAGLLLAGLLAWTVRSGLEDPPAAVPAATEPMALADLPDSSFTLPPLEQFQVIAARPLFVPDRRPAAAQAQPEATVADLTLVGIVAERGRPRAVLRSADGRTLTLGEGEAALGWRVVRIEGRRVGVDNAGLTRELSLTARRTAPTPSGMPGGPGGPGMPIMPDAPAEAAAPPLPGGLP